MPREERGAKRPRIVILTEARIGARMAGTGIRYYEIAKHLSSHLDVVLGSIYPVEIVRDEFEQFSWNTTVTEELRNKVESADFILIHGYVLDKLPWLRSLGAKIVVDLYNPFLFENAEIFRDRGESSEQREAASARDREVLLRQLESGDYFICASERQRDWILGMLTATGQLQPDILEGCRTPESLIGVVPTGVAENATLTRLKPAIKGVWPGIKNSDVVLIWGGGLWSWLDAETVIRAMAQLEAGTETTIKLFFLSQTAVETTIDMPASQRALSLAEDLNLLGRTVVFNRDYVPYEERLAYFLDADIGVCADVGSLESHFSFRTRVLDYLNAGLPVLTTAGDFFADFVTRHRIGLALPPGDIQAWAEAIGSLAEDRDRRHLMAEKSLARRSDFSWVKSVEPLLRYCTDNGHLASPRGRVRGWGAWTDFEALKCVYDEAVAYARHVEDDLGRVTAVAHEALSDLSALKTEKERLEARIRTLETVQVAETERQAWRKRRFGKFRW